MKLQVISSLILIALIGEQANTQETTTAKVRTNFFTRRPYPEAVTVQSLSPSIKQHVGSHVELECTASGTPPITFRWYRKDFLLGEYKSLHALEQGSIKVVSRLVINYLLPRHQGEYRCSAMTDSKESSCTIQLTIDSTGSNETVRTRENIHMYRPRVVFWAKLMIELIGTDVVLPCVADGYPVPELHWFHPESTRITTDERWEILPDGSLKIKSLRKEDMGIFTCKVSNSVGSDVVKTFIYPASELNPLLQFDKL